MLQMFARNAAVCTDVTTNTQVDNRYPLNAPLLIMQKMTDKGRFDVYVVFTIVLCDTSVNFRRRRCKRLFIGLV